MIFPRAGIQLKKYREAIDDYERTLELNPRFARAYDNYAWLLATAEDPEFRDPTQAVFYAQKACELTGHENWSHISTLAASYAEAGDFHSARKWLVKSHQLAPEDQKIKLVKLVKLYESELHKSTEVKANPEKKRIRL